MIVYKDYLVKRLPGYIIDTDSYKDINDKGFVQRYIEIFGEELDDYYSDKLENLSDLYSPLSCDPVYLDYIATMLGDLPRYLSNNDDFAQLLTYILSIYRAKGTKKSYQAILGTLGFNSVTLNEFNPGTGVYDEDPLTYYDTGLLYDDGCKTCSDYEVVLTGTGPITAELFQKAKELIAIVEPLGATLLNIYYNGDIIVAVYIEVTINDDGDLVYDNTNDPGLILTLVDGDLVISGPNADKYFLDENGDLYYVL